MKIVFLLLLFLLQGFANIKFYNKTVNNVYLSENKGEYKPLSHKTYKRKDLKEFSIKMHLNKDVLEKETYYMTIVSDVDSLSYINTQFVRQNHIMIVKLDKNSPETLKFEYKYKKPKWGEFRVNVINEFEHDNILHYEGILYGLAYGIIFCAFLYYIIIYFSTRLKCFLYYSLMQLSVLFSLLWFTYFSFQAYIYSYQQAAVDICETSAFLFTILFVKEILYTKTHMPFMDKVLNLFVVLNILDIFLILIFKYSILYEYMPFYIGFLIPSIAGFIAINKKIKYATIYTIGWFIMCCFIFITENRMFPLSGIYAMHIATPLESLVFSFALGVMLKEIVDEQNEKEKLLVHKSKLASMGEMINNIAHQWRQPLTHLGFVNMNMQLALEDKTIDKAFLKNKIIESNEQIEFMSNTINSFRDFYKPEKEKELFWISEAVESSITIMYPLLEIYNIKLDLMVVKDQQIKSYKNEFAQVILNLLTNAKDELINNQIKDPYIFIKITRVEGKSITTVCDNAGGIDEKNINKIFEPYFSTKEEGSGIGLYMSKTIINSHFKGELTAKNSKDGACFTVSI